MSAADALRDLLRAPAPAAVGRGRRAAADRRTRSTRSSSPTALGFDSVWEVEHHFLEEYSHSSASDVFLAAAVAAHEAHPPRASGSCRCRRATSTPRAWPRRSAMLDLVSEGRVRVRHGRDLGGRRARRLRRRPRDQARAVGRGARRRHADDGRGAVRRLRRALRRRCRRATSSPSPCRSPTRRCGSPARGARRSAWPREKGIGALSLLLRRARGGQGVGRRVPRDHRLRALRPGRLRGQPEASPSCCR